MLVSATSSNANSPERLDTMSRLGVGKTARVVPGMRHFRERQAPGRMYNVPVSMGHRTEPLAESELNNMPVIA